MDTGADHSEQKWLGQIGEAIHVYRLFHVELLYGVLSHLDLRPDCANLYRADLYRPGLSVSEWVAGMVQAYRRAPGRLVLQALPLWVRDLDSLNRALRSGWPQPLDSDGLLAQCCQQAISQLQPDLWQRWQQTTLPSQVISRIGDRLLRLRQLLYAPAQPPPLKLYDCDHLQNQGGSHGRCSQMAGEVILAVSLAAPEDQLLCQMFHEESHIVSDPRVTTESKQTRDTQPDSPGFRRHNDLEMAAITLGQELLESHMPDMCPAYQVWRQRHNI